MKKKLLILVSLIAWGIVLSACWPTPIQDNWWDTNPQVFGRSGLSTDTSKTSINLDEVLDGWPGKDGIPSIDTPSFVSISDPSNTYLSPESEWILVNLAGTKKWYSYNILNRHEIVNDSFGEWEDQTLVAVTFCPLCGSALVFDRTVDGQLLEFGVSGKLHNSNLLMYDRTNESLRSQSLGEAVVGEFLGTKLDFVDADLLTRQEVQEFYPDAEILSTDTGANRRYDRIPYWDYDTNDDLFFPVANKEDVRFPLKTRMFISNISDTISIAYHMEDLKDLGTGTIDVDGVIYTATFDRWNRKIADPDGNQAPWYFEMRFSRANKNARSKYVWSQ